MANYYEILGVSSDADSRTIRIAYKRLAMLYHPDRNPGNVAAEEAFKEVNHAYQILSDPLKRARYDAGQNPSYAPVEEAPDWRDVQRTRYERWQKVHQQRYTFGKEYFRIQGLAFLVFLLIAAFCFGIFKLVNTVVQMKYDAIYKENSLLLNEVDKLFDRGQVADAFKMLDKLQQKAPNEYRFIYEHDSLLDVLRAAGERNYFNDNYQEAGQYYELLKKYEVPQRLETLERAAVCEYHAGNFEEALTTLKHLHNQESWNLDLVYQIAIIDLDKLNNKTEALQYFNLGKKLFKENLSRVYGSAFEVVMNPADAPDIYYDIFVGRARTNIALEHFDEAATDCNWAIFLRPKKSNPYILRAIANVRNGTYDRVCQDLASAKSLGNPDAEQYERKYCR